MSLRTSLSIARSFAFDRASTLSARFGVVTESLSETIRVATIGDVGPALAKFDAGDRQVPIRVQLDGQARADRQTLEQLRVPLAAAAVFRLASVADIRA